MADRPQVPSGIGGLLGQLGGGILDVLQGGPGGWNPPKTPEETRQRIEFEKARQAQAPTDKKSRQYAAAVRALENYSLATWSSAPGAPPPPPPPPPPGGFGTPPNLPATIPQPAPGPGIAIEPTTDISAVLKRFGKLPASLGRLIEFLSTYRNALLLIGVYALDEWIGRYNQSVKLDEKQKADEQKRLDKEIRDAVRDAVKEAREQYRFDKERAADAEREAEKAWQREHAKEAAEVSAAAWELKGEAQRIKRQADALMREREIQRRQIERRQAARTAPPPPVPKPVRVQQLETLFKGIMAVQSIRQQRQRTPGVIVNQPGVPMSPPQLGSDYSPLTDFNPGALGWDNPELLAGYAASSGTATGTADEVCSCRPRYPPKRRKSSRRKICYYRD